MRDLQPFARGYQIEPFWSYDRAGGGLLIANGTGVMLAAMDEIPTLSWCADVTGLRDDRSLERWLGFAQCARHVCSHVAATLICFIDDPAPLRTLLAVFDADRLAVYGNQPLHDVCQREWPGFVELACSQSAAVSGPGRGVEPSGGGRDKDTARDLSGLRPRQDAAG